jgi:hypothetical protein
MFSELVVAGLATWRLSRMLLYEAGPSDIIVRARSIVGVSHDSNDTPVVWPSWLPFDCVNCMSVWVAPVVLLMPRWLRAVLALSGLAVMLEEFYQTQMQGNTLGPGEG